MTAATCRRFTPLAKCQKGGRGMSSEAATRQRGQRSLPLGTPMSARLVRTSVCRGCTHPHKYESAYLTGKVVFIAACGECGCTLSGDDYEGIVTSRPLDDYIPPGAITDVTVVFHDDDFDDHDGPPAATIYHDDDYDLATAVARSAERQSQRDSLCVVADSSVRGGRSGRPELRVLRHSRVGRCSRVAQWLSRISDRWLSAVIGPVAVGIGERNLAP